MDPGCASLEDDDEHDTKTPSNFDFTLGSDAYGGAYLSQLTWKGKPVVRDGGSTRFYLHNDRSSTTNYTSGLQFFQVSRKIIAEIWVAFFQNLSDNLADRSSEARSR